MNHQHTLAEWNRRDFLAIGSLATTGLVLSPLISSTTRAVAPEVNFSNALSYRFQLGEWEAFALADGSQMNAGALNFMFPAAARPQMRQALEQAAVAADAIQFYYNILVLCRGQEVVLFDGGNGMARGPQTGRLLAQMQTVGLEPGDVTHVLLSHAHPDHIGGLVDDQGKVVFSKAQVLISEKEHAFWQAESPDFSKSVLPKERIEGMVKLARGNLNVLASRLEVLPFGTQVLDSITLEDGAGHTPGHTVYRIVSGGEEMFHIVDLAHNHVVMLADPTWHIAFDIQPEQAVERRKFWFKQLAETRTPVFGFHLPFPALGNIVTAGEGYRWVPQSWI